MIRYSNVDKNFNFIIHFRTKFTAPPKLLKKKLKRSSLPS